MVFVYLHEQNSAEDLEKEKLDHSIDVSPLIKSIQDLYTAAQGINIRERGMDTFDKLKQVKLVY